MTNQRCSKYRSQQKTNGLSAVEAQESHNSNLLNQPKPAPKFQILFHKKRGHHRTLLERTLFLPLASESEHHTSSSSFLMMSVRPSMIASRMCLVASSNILTCSGSDLSKRLNRGCLMRLLRSFFQQPSLKKVLRTRQQSCVDRFSCDLQRCGLPCLLLLLLPCASVPAQHSEYELQKLI